MKNMPLLLLNSTLKELVFSKQNTLKTLNISHNQYQKILKNILQEYNCSFRYWKPGIYKKKGHLKYTTKNGHVYREIAITPYPQRVEQLYLILHELVHLINDHPKSKELTTKQKEIVADTVPKMIISALGMEDKLKKSTLFTDLNLGIYSLLWMKRGTLTKAKTKVVLLQIEYSYEYLTQKLQLTLKTCKVNA